jgi:hypothetical protein
LVPRRSLGVVNLVLLKWLCFFDFPGRRNTA